MGFLAAIAAVIAALWTGFVVFANMMKPGETGAPVGLWTIPVAWLIVAGLAIAWKVG